PGTYLSRDTAASIRFAIAAVPKSRLAEGAAVFYVEVARTARPGGPFFQRFLRLEDDGARVSIRVFEPRDLAGVRGKWREPDALALFSARDVRERPDCRIALAKSPAGHWTGGTPGATCFSAAANTRLAVSMSLSPQTLEWREEGRDEAGKTVLGPFGEIAVFAREGTPHAPSAPADGGVNLQGALSSKVNEPRTSAPPVLEVASPSSPPKNYTFSDLRGIAGAERLSIDRLVGEPAAADRGAAVVVVTSSRGTVSVFSFTEISSPGGPTLDVTGATLRLVASPGRELEDVVSVELRALAPGR
ncbi:MAG: CpcT/CpeT family chromophore lyase, partial [Thermoanaerobaculia bacterium]